MRWLGSSLGATEGGQEVRKMRHSTRSIHKTKEEVEDEDR